MDTSSWTPPPAPPAPPGPPTAAWPPAPPLGPPTVPPTGGAPGAGAPPVGSSDLTWGTPAGPGWGRPDPGAPPAGPPPAAPGSGTSPGGRRAPRVAGFALLAALLLGGAAGAGYAGGTVAADDEPAATAPTATTPTVQGVGDPADEPVAAVAEALGPAVVQLETGTGLGSGFVYDADAGLIMTAAHVVDGAQQVTVRLADGRSVDGTVVGADDGSDIAVVRVEADGLTAATLALDDPAEVGQLAVAIGSPFGLDQTVTSGVVSAVGRSVETPGGAVPMIQTDAPINPGNSGGALADRSGRVIGVNDSIASESGGNVGVGFAVPIETAKAVADRLVEGLPITNGYLGVSAADATGDRSGAQVVEVEAGSPGGEAGIEPGDVITSLDDQSIDSAADLVAAVRSREPGTEVTVGVDRQGDEVEVALTLGEAPTR
jgi:putative serine protease PepD